MIRIAIYPSSHGFGHVSRMSALAEQLNAFGLYTIIRTDRPTFLLQNLNPEMNEISIASTDFGVIHTKDLAMDIEGTKRALIDLMSRRREIVDHEVEWLRSNKIDLVISDIPFLPCEAASYAGIPVFAISNFDWAFIYSEMFRNDPEMTPIVNCIAGIYQRADQAFRLPFSSLRSMGSFAHVRKIGLLAREKALYQDIRAIHGIAEDRLIILSLVSGLDSIDLNTEELAHKLNAFVITTRDLQNVKDVITIPQDAAILDYIHGADLILTKPGYGIFSEGVQFGKPFIIRERKDYPEERILVDQLKRDTQVYDLSSGIDGVPGWLSNIKGSGTASKRRNSNLEIAGAVFSSFIAHKHKNDRLVSVYDIGSNNLNYLLYDCRKGQTIHKHQAQTGLGIGLKQGRLSSKSIAKFKKVFRSIRRFDQDPAIDTICFATEAVRKASNKSVMQNFISHHGTKLRILEPRDEARLVYHTVKDKLDPSVLTLVLDIGGRSCEFCLVRDRKLVKWKSIPIGLQSFLYYSSDAVFETLRKGLLDMGELPRLGQFVTIGLTAEMIGILLAISKPAGDAWPSVKLSEIRRAIIREENPADRETRLVINSLEIIVYVMEYIQAKKVYLCYDGINVGFAQEIKREK